jgi:hypothetical protein
LGRAPGAGIDNTTFMATITSYDYDTFIAEAGGYDQPGVGGNGNKYQVALSLLLLKSRLVTVNFMFALLVLRMSGSQYRDLWL